MAIIEKLITLVRGTATEAGQAIVDRNAITILEQETRDSKAALEQSKVDLTKLMAERKLASDKLDSKKAKVDELSASIQKLVAKGDQQALALEVAGKVATLENEIKSDSATIAGMDANIDRLRASIRQAESTIEHLSRQIDTVKATASVQHVRLQRQAPHCHGLAGSHPGAAAPEGCAAGRGKGAGSLQRRRRSREAPAGRWRRRHRHRRGGRAGPLQQAGGFGLTPSCRRRRASRRLYPQG